MLFIGLDVISKFVFFLTICFYLLFAGQTPTQAQTSEWRPVSGSRQANLSGMALVEHNAQKTVFIIVNDNKKKEQNHAALLTVEGRNAPKYTPLKWLGDDIPTDLEAVSAVPEMKNDFMAFTAAGRVFHIELNRTDNAVWAERGLDAKPATLFWSKLDLKSYTFSQLGSASVKVPYPVGNTRNISDVKIDQTGAVFISSAADPGNDGPFASAVYFAGTFSVDNPPNIKFVQPSALTRLFIFDCHKIESIEFVPGADGGLAFGTDDENLGSSIYLNW